MYITAEQVKTVVELAKQLPNDQDLGKKFRSVLGETEIAREFPNDFELGTELRKIFNRKR
jgi:hypothetical protein